MRSICLFVFASGDKSQELILVRRGLLAVMNNKVDVLQYVIPGQCAGEMVFKYGGRHQLPIVAKENSTVYVCSRKEFDNILFNSKKYFDMFPLLHDQLPGANMNYLYLASKVIQYEKGDHIFTAGHNPVQFYIILQGELSL